MEYENTDLESLSASIDPILQFKVDFDNDFAWDKIATGIEIKSGENMKIIVGDQDEFDDQSAERLRSFKETADYGLFKERLGLSFERLETVTRESSSPIKRDVETYKLMYKLKDSEAFIQFLEGLEVEDLQFNPGVRVLLESVLVDFKHYILDHADINNPSQEAVNLYISMNRIVKECKRLSLLDAKDDSLEGYALHLRNKTLKEYLEAQKMRLLEGPEEGFGPGKWVIDITPENLNKGWGEAIALVRKTSKRPEAVVFGKELRDHLLASIDFANAEMDSWVKNDVLNDHLERSLPHFRKTLSEAKQNLEMIEFVAEIDR